MTGKRLHTLFHFFFFLWRIQSSPPNLMFHGVYNLKCSLTSGNFVWGNGGTFKQFIRDKEQDFSLLYPL